VVRPSCQTSQHRGTAWPPRSTSSVPIAPATETSCVRPQPPLPAPLFRCSRRSSQGCLSALGSCGQRMATSAAAPPPEKGLLLPHTTPRTRTGNARRAFRLARAIARTKSRQTGSSYADSRQSEHAPDSNVFLALLCLNTTRFVQWLFSQLEETVVSVRGARWQDCLRIDDKPRATKGATEPPEPTARQARTRAGDSVIASSHGSTGHRRRGLVLLAAGRDMENGDDTLLPSPTHRVADGRGAGMAIMVNYYRPDSLSVSDYEVYRLSDHGTIDMNALRQRFNISAACLLDGHELAEDAGVLAHLNISNDLDITGDPIVDCGNVDGDRGPAGGACALQ